MHVSLCVYVCALRCIHIHDIVYERLSTFVFFHFSNIYWTDAGAKSISVAKSDGRYVKILFTGLEYPLAVAVNPRSGWDTAAFSFLVPLDIIFASEVPRFLQIFTQLFNWRHTSTVRGGMWHTLKMKIKCSSEAERGMFQRRAKNLKQKWLRLLRKKEEECCKFKKKAFSI